MTKKVHEGNQYKKIAKHGIWYVISSIVTKVSGILLLPLYTRYLSPADYGLIGALESATLIFPVFVSLALDSAFLRFYYEDRAVSKEAVARLYSTQFWFVATWGVFATLVASIPVYFFVNTIETVPFWPLIPLATLSPLFQQLAVMGSGVFDAELKAKEVSVINIITYVGSLIVTVLTVVVLHWGVAGKLSGALFFPITASAIYTGIAIRKGWIRWQFDWTILKRSFAYALPTLPTAAVVWLYSQSNKLFLAHYGELADVGIFVMASQFAIILNVLAESIGRVGGAVAMSALIDNVELGKQKIRGFVGFFVWAMAGVFLGLCLFSKEAIFIFTEASFHDAYLYVPLLALPYFISGIYRTYSTVVAYYKMTWIYTAAAFCTAFVNVGLNVLLIPEYGKLGAAISTLAASVVYAIWIIGAAQRKLPIQSNWALIVPVATIATVCLGLFIALSQAALGLWPELLAKCGLLFTYAAATLAVPSVRTAIARQLGPENRFGRLLAIR